MVNSGSFDAAGSEGELVKAEFTQLEDDAAEASFTAVVPEDVAPKPSLQCSVPLDKVKNVLKSKLLLDTYFKQKTELGDAPDASKKRLMCLFCDRTFTSNNLKQKHVDRCHAAGQTRRSSCRTPSHSQSATACCFCSKLNHTDHTLKQLLEHLVNEHSNRYFACLTCQERFSSVQVLRDHNRSVHGLQDTPETKTPSSSPVTTSDTSSTSLSDVVRPELKRISSSDSSSSFPATPKENSSPSNSTKTLKRNSSLKNTTTPEKQENVGKDTGFHEDFEDAIHANVISPEDAKNVKQSEEDDEDDLVLARRVKNGIVSSKTKNTHKKNQIGNKKISVKSTKNGLRNNLRTTRSSVKQLSNNFTKNRKKIVKHESEPGKQVTFKRPVPNPASVFSLVNAYIYKYEKIYDHASDSIKDANSVQFNAVFDKEFYSRTVCNIRENLLHHLDGKLNRNVESENRISNFEHNSSASETEAKPTNDTVDNFGCDLSLNAVTPVATLLGSSQYGEDLDAQIEYGAKASQKKPKKVTVVKYKFPNKKFNTLIQEKDSQNDLTCLDMWTQLSVKKRQHKINADTNFSEDLRNYHRPTGESKVQVDELNKILDTRGPFEDLRLEANAQQFLELRKKSAKEGDYISEESSKDVYFVIEDLLNRVMCKISENTVSNSETDVEENKKENEESKLDVTQTLELPSYLQLEKSPAKLNEFKMDKTDSIAIICASQEESEMKENKRMELTGEWARPRIYICATCGLKLSNLKILDDHKNVTHPHIWCGHYEFVGNQSQIYRHLSIPGLGKVGIVEKLPLNRQWQRSDARTCSKCSKQCHNLGELHKHILECGGDWTWMLARKKCKYRPYGSRSRRRRQRGYKRSCNPEVNRAREHKPKIKPLFIGPRPKPTKPSDAETIERMLANLPPKRHRKMISMRDGIQRPRKTYKQKLNQSSSNTQTTSSPKLNNKKVHFKNNSPQITKQTLRNALKRKITANNLRKHNKNDSDSSDTPLTLRSKIKSDSNDEADKTQKLIGNRNKIRNHRMISRILGSKIFDSNSALITRRKLAKAIAQTNLIRKTRLRSKMQSQKNSNKLKEDEMVEKPEATLPSKTRSLEKSPQDNEKKTKNSSKNNTDEADSKLNKMEDSNSKTAESDAKVSKKSSTKRFLSVLTKSSKKTKIPISDKDKPDTISAIIDDVINRAVKNEAFDLKFDTKKQKAGKNKRKTRSSLPKNEPSESKINVEETAAKKINNNSDDVKNNDNKPEKVISKKKNKLVQNVKSFRKSFRKKDKSGEKSEGIASKLIRTLSIRGSKKKKTETKSSKSNTLETIDQEIDLKKTTTDVSNQTKEPENSDQIPDLKPMDKQCDIEDSIKANTDSDMPTLEKIEPLPSHVSLSNSNSIPILCPVNINTSESDLSVDKESKSDSDVCNDNKTDLKSCDISSASNCNSSNKLKNKTKRSGRGLNDCIAMLKCKLEQKQQPSNEPSLVDKSNLFILNSTEVIKHSQLIVQEKLDVSHSDTDESTKMNTETTNDIVKKDEIIDSNKLDDSKVSENIKTNEVKKEPRKLERKVLEIPSFKLNISAPEISTVETQTQTVDEDLVPNAAIDYIPTNIETNFQLSYVLNATLQNCLMECVKNKCEELKIENQNLKGSRSNTKIGSVRKRAPKANLAEKEKRINTLRKQKTNTLTKEKPPICEPVILNSTFTENNTPKNVTHTSNSNSKAASDTSEDDIPLSKLVSTPPSTNLKVKIPVAKKKRSSKKHIPFTPLILNEESQTQITLTDQRISLDNSLNNKLEEKQTDINTTEEKVNDVVSESTIETNTKEEIPQINSDVINKEENASLNKESENTPVDLSTKDDLNTELQTTIKEILPEDKNVNSEEPISNVNIEESISNVNHENQDVTISQEQSNEIVSESAKEVLQENTENLTSADKVENIPEIVNKECAPTKDILESLQPLSQQIMSVEDEPCDSFLINKTLTEANIKPTSPTKNSLQNNSLSESVDDQSNHFDSGKENTECQGRIKSKRIVRRTKKKRGKSKSNNLSDEIIDSSLSTDVDQSVEKLVENFDTSIENIPQLGMEDTSTPLVKVQRRRGKVKKAQPEITESDMSTTDLDTTPSKTADLTKDIPKRTRTRRKIIEKEQENSESDNLSTNDLNKTEETNQNIVVSNEKLSEEILPKDNDKLIKPVRKCGRRKKIPVDTNESTDSAMPTDSETETSNKEVTKNNSYVDIKRKGRQSRRKKSDIIALSKLINSETTEISNESSSQAENININSENERNIENLNSETGESSDVSKPVDSGLETTGNKELLNESSSTNDDFTTNSENEITNIENVQPEITHLAEQPIATCPDTEIIEANTVSEDNVPKLIEENKTEIEVSTDEKTNTVNPKEIVEKTKPRKKPGRKKKIEIQTSENEEPLKIEITSPRKRPSRKKNIEVKSSETEESSEIDITNCKRKSGRKKKIEVQPPETEESSKIDVETVQQVAEINICDVPSLVNVEENISGLDQQLDTIINEKIENIPNEQCNIAPSVKLSEETHTNQMFVESIQTDKILEQFDEMLYDIDDKNKIENEQSDINESISNIITDLNELIKESEDNECALPTENIIKENVQKPEETFVKVKKRPGRKKKITQTVTDTSLISDLDTSTNTTETNITNEKPCNTTKTRKSNERRGKKKKAHPEDLTDISKPTELEELINKSESDVNNVVGKEICNVDESERKLENRGRKKRVVPETIEKVTDESTELDVGNTTNKNERGRKKKSISETIERVIEESTKMDLENVMNNTENNESKMITEEIYNESVPDTPVINIVNESKSVDIITDKICNENISEIMIESNTNKNVEAISMDSGNDIASITNLETINENINTTVDNETNNHAVLERSVEQKSVLENMYDVTEITDLIITKENDLSNILNEKLDNEGTLESSNEDLGIIENILPKNIESVTDTTVTNLDETINKTEDTLNETVVEQVSNKNKSKRKGGRKKKVLSESLELTKISVVPNLDKTVIENEISAPSIEEICIEKTSEKNSKRRGRKKKEKIQLENIKNVTYDRSSTPILDQISDTDLHNILNEETNNENGSERTDDKEEKQKHENIEAPTDFSATNIEDNSVTMSENDVNTILSDEIFKTDVQEKTTGKRGRKKKEKIQLENINVTYNRSSTPILDQISDTDLHNILNEQTNNENDSERTDDKEENQKYENMETAIDFSTTKIKDNSMTISEHDVNTILTDEIFKTDVPEKTSGKRGRKKKVPLENIEAITDISTTINLDKSISRSETDLSTMPNDEIFNVAVERKSEKRGKKKKKIQSENHEVTTDISKETNLDEPISKSEIDLNTIPTEVILERKSEKRGKKKKKIQSENEEVQINNSTETYLDKSIKTSDIDLNNIIGDIYSSNSSERTTEKRNRRKNLQNETFKSQSEMFTANLNKTMSKSDNNLSNIIEEEMEEDTAEITGETTIKIKRGRRKTINVELNTTYTIVDTSIDSDVNKTIQNIENTDNISQNIENINSVIHPNKQFNVEDILQETIEPIKLKKKRGRKKTVHIQPDNTELISNEPITELNQSIKKLDDSVISNDNSITENIEEKTSKRKSGRRKSNISSSQNEIINEVSDTVSNDPGNNQSVDDTTATDKVKRKRTKRKTVHLNEEINESQAANKIEQPNEVDTSIFDFDEVDSAIIDDSRPKRKRSRDKIYTEPEIEDSVTLTPTENTDQHIENTDQPTENTDQSTENIEINITETPVEDTEIDENQSVTNFRTQLQSVVENEPEISVMENKNIQETLPDAITPAEHNSDSEDELPLAALLKKDNLQDENIESLITDKSEVDSCVLSDSDNKMTNNTITENVTTCTENNLNAEEKHISENQEIADFEEESSNLDDNLFDSVDNNEDFSYDFTEEDMDKSTEDISSLIENNDILTNDETDNPEIQNTITNPTGLLETHFDLQTDNKIERKNIKSEYRNIETENLNRKDEENNKNSNENVLNYESMKQDNQSLLVTSPDTAKQSIVIKIKNFGLNMKKPKKSRRRVIPKSLARGNLRKKENDDIQIIAVCEICNKTFKRKENLASHKRTLTHIAKLSELEAKESLARQVNEEIEENRDIEETEENRDNIEETEEHNLEDIPYDNKNENINEDECNLNEIVKDLTPENENNEYILGDNEIPELENEDSNLNVIKNNLLLDIQEHSSDNVALLEDKELIEHESSNNSREIIEENDNFENNVEPSVSQPVEILDMKPRPQTANLIPGLNTNLKLVDIISQVLDKPVNDLICDGDYLPQNITRSANNCDSNDKYSEPKRYKSLGERKSFDSDHFNSTSKCNDEITKETYSTSLGSINNGLLSKQLSLLENIIEETNPNLNYIDDSISLSSNHFDDRVEHNISEKELFKPGYNKLTNPQIKFSHTADVLSNLMKPNNRFNNFQNISDSFAKPSKQDETINKNEIEIQKKSTKDSKRKILNRDEELFLECCSLLKSGSEISSVSKKSTKNIPLNSFSRSNDASWIMQKQPNSDQFIQRDSYSWLAQSSRVDTPIGEPFVNNDWSNSNSAVSSEWLAQKAPSPDRPTENNTLLKKCNNNSGETKYSDIQFEDISIDTSLETSKTLMAIDNSNTENVPLDFHHVDFSNKNLIEKPGVQRENPETEQLQIDPFIDINENSESTTSSTKQLGGVRLKKDIFIKPALKPEEYVSNNDEYDPDLKKKVASAFGGLMAKALSNRLHAAVKKSKKAKGKRDFASSIQASITDYAVPVKKNKLTSIDSDSNDCPKKLITKGAMKVFEGLKVSIPTQDLNLKEVLNCNIKPKNGETEPELPKTEDKETTDLEMNHEKAVKINKNGKLKNLFSRFGNKLGLKETKKKASKHRSKSKNQIDIKKTHDVYEFEESMDNNLFKAGKFSLFRNKDQNSETDADTSKKNDGDKNDETKCNHESGIGSLKWNGNESDSDTDRYYDSMSFEEMSLSSESTHGSDLNTNKTKPIQKKPVEKSKDNQKKCMIMGRIFKNASKPKLEDKIPEIRDISSEENSKLVGNYLDSCSSVDNVENTDNRELPVVPNNVTVVNNSVNKMSKIEMDLLFDKLLHEEKSHEEIPAIIPIENSEITEHVENTESVQIDKNLIEKKKIKEGKSKNPGKIKKRQRHNSGDSTSSDEFTLGGRHSKSSKKHHKTPRKSTKPKKDTGINLEQEFKECIGVAGRKSQRKCTSGKQNVLIEFWSSDESSFEEVIKMLGKENEPVAPVENENEEVEQPFIEPEEPLLNINNDDSIIKEDLPVGEIVESVPENNIDVYDFESDVEPKQDALKIKIKLIEPGIKSESNFIASTKIKIPKKPKRVGKNRKHSKSHGEESDDTEFEMDKNRKREHKRKKPVDIDDPSLADDNPDCLAVTRKKRNAGDQLYYWSSSSDDEFQDLIEVKPIREDTDDDRPMQHGWIVGDSPKKLVTMLAQAKGKKVEGESVKEQGKKNRVTL